MTRKKLILLKVKTDPSISPRELARVYRQAVEKGLPLKKLEARISRRLDQIEVSQEIKSRTEQTRVKKMKKKLPKVVRYGAFLVPAVLIVVGFYLLGNAVVPLTSYYATDFMANSNQKLLAPIPAQEVLNVTPLAVETSLSGKTAGVSDSQEGPVILDTELDYTNLSNWFKDERSQVLTAQAEEKTYFLEIPKLNIEKAKVLVGGTNLDESLIAYPGTALPGETGSPVIFGHSVLRQFYQPSQQNPRRYNSIFSYIMTLEDGDEIFLIDGDVTYRYVVRDKTEVKPEDTYILAQQHDSRLLKLVTCVPEGTYLRRGVVTAELVSR